MEDMIIMINEYVVPKYLINGDSKLECISIMYEREHIDIKTPALVFTFIRNSRVNYNMINIREDIKTLYRLMDRYDEFRDAFFWIGTRYDYNNW